MPDIEEVLSGGAGDAGGGGGGKKKLSVERIYQKKTQLEHILLRPDTYIGSVEKVTQVELILWFCQVICLFMSLHVTSGSFRVNSTKNLQKYSELQPRILQPF